MAEQKNQNEHLNVEDALTQSEAFLIKYKNAIIGAPSNQSMLPP